MININCSTTFQCAMQTFYDTLSSCNFSFTFTICSSSFCVNFMLLRNLSTSTIFLSYSKDISELSSSSPSPPFLNCLLHLSQEGSFHYKLILNYHPHPSLLHYTISLPRPPLCNYLLTPLCSPSL